MIVLYIFNSGTHFLINIPSGLDPFYGVIYPD